MALDKKFEDLFMQVSINAALSSYYLVGKKDKNAADKAAVDMMRVLEHGYNVKMIPTNHLSHAVDTKEDLLMVEKLLSENAN